MHGLSINSTISLIISCPLYMMPLRLDIAHKLTIPVPRIPMSTYSKPASAYHNTPPTTHHLSSDILTTQSLPNSSLSTDRRVTRSVTSVSQAAGRLQCPLQAGPSNQIKSTYSGQLPVLLRSIIMALHDSCLSACIAGYGDTQSDLHRAAPSPTIAPDWSPMSEKRRISIRQVECSLKYSHIIVKKGQTAYIQILLTAISYNQKNVLTLKVSGIVFSLPTCSTQCHALKSLNPSALIYHIIIYRYHLLFSVYQQF